MRTRRSHIRAGGERSTYCAHSCVIRFVKALNPCVRSLGKWQDTYSILLGKSWHWLRLLIDKYSHASIVRVKNGPCVSSSGVYFYFHFSSKVSFFLQCGEVVKLRFCHYALFLAAACSQYSKTSSARCRSSLCTAKHFLKRLSMDLEYSDYYIVTYFPIF